MVSPMYSARLETIRTWQAAQSPSGRISDSDAELIAALGPLSDGGAGWVLWSDSDSLMMRWSELRTVFSVEAELTPPVPSETHSDATPEFVSPSPAADLDGIPPMYAGDGQFQGEITRISDEPAEPVDPIQVRTERILAWYAEHQSERADVAALDEKSLAKLGRARAETSGAVRAFLSANRGGAVTEALAEEITGVLAGRARQALIPEAEVPVSLTPPAAASLVPGFFAEPGVFSDFDWDNFVEVDAASVPNLTIIRRSDKLMLSWSPDDSPGTSIYRVVCSPDSWALMSPDGAQLVGATDQTTVETQLPARSVVTYLTVFVNNGADETTARSGQPRVHAKGQVVWPPTDVRVEVDPVRRVVGKFEVPLNAQIEVQRRLSTGFAGYDPARRLSGQATVTNTGFVDPSPPLAVDVIYAVFTSTTLPTGETISSEPVERTVKVVPPPQPPELSVTHSSPGFYDLAWDPPGFGVVEVYMRNEPLPPGFIDEVRSRAQLEDQQLKGESMLLYPVVNESGRQVMRGCSSNPEWVQTHFTVAHVVDEDHIGLAPSVSQVVVPPPTHVAVIERVDSEIVTFAWPRGVGLVEIYRGPRGSEALDLSVNDPMMSLTEDAYFRMGGMHLTDTLPPNGCSLHLYGVVYTPQALRSEPVILDYPGIVRVRYRLVWLGANGAVAEQGSAAALRVEVYSDETLQGVQMSLVSHPNRLPLHPQEVGGSLVAAETVSVNANTTGVAFQLPANSVTGWVRVFVTSVDQAGQYALLDPPVKTLNLTPGGMQ